MKIQFACLAVALSGLLAVIPARAADSPPACSASPADTGAIVSSIRAWYSALETGDAARFHAQVTEDFVAFDGGERYAGDALFDAIRAQQAKGWQSHWTNSAPQVQTDCNTALATFATHGVFDSVATDKHQELDFIESAVLRKADERWRIAFFHSTAVPKAPSSSGETK